MRNLFAKKVVSLCSATALLLSLSSQLAFAVDSDDTSVQADETAKIFINEICTGNNGENGNLTDATDKKGEYCDWIELYNAGDVDVDISGWTLVKDYGGDSASEYVFSSVTLPAGGYTVVYCCKTYSGDKSLPYASYNLPAEGVTLGLTDGENEVDVVTCPSLEKDTVWARKPDGSDNFAVLYPSPRDTNDTAQSAIPCNAPVLSAESGMYTDSFDLEMTTDSGNTIYYTTDGTDPSTSSTRIEYTAPVNIYNRSGDKSTMARRVAVSKITPWSNNASLPDESAVDKGTVIRACTLSAAGEYSDTVTKSYFVGVSNADHNNLPILSVTTDPDNLFDYDTGINVLGRVYDDYVASGGTDTSNPQANYNQKGEEWERACHIDFFESDGSLVLSQDCGMRTQGAYSRADYQKSFRFYARSEYGEKNFKYPFFENSYKKDGSGELNTKFKKFVMRNGGNDTFYAKFKDNYIQSLVADRSVETQSGRACVMFIDGEYWGLYTLQEDYSDDYFEENYGVDKDEVIVYKKGEIDEGEESDIAYFNEMKNFARNNDLSITENYEKMCEMLDIQSFIDYMATEIYIINEDWPGNNYALWRVRNTDDSNPYADGKWRCMLYDTEMGVDHYGNSTTKYNVDNLKKILSNKSDNLTIIFNALIKNAEFKERFVTSFMDITNVNFNYNTTVARKQVYMETYYPEMEKFFKRFPTWAAIWNTDNCLSRMNTFLKNRPSYVTKMLKSNLSLSDTVSVNISAINADGGTVTLNTSTLDLSTAFSGSYFTDYNITLTAEAKEGYKFAGWTGTYISGESSISISPSKATGIQAIFVAEGEESSVCKVTFKSDSESYEVYVLRGGTAEIPSGVFDRTGYKTTTSGSLTNIQSDTVIGISYTPITYKIRYKANGGSGNSYTQGMTYDVAADILDCEFTKDGYIFKGWAKSSSAQTADYKAGQTVKNLTANSSAVITLYAVWARDISICTVNGLGTKYIYMGNAIRPTVQIKDGTTVLKSGTDYTVSYANYDSCGTAKIKIVGKGSYSGSRTLTYKIAPSAVEITKISRSQKAVRIYWSEVKGADSYVIYKLSGSAYKKLAVTSKLSYYDGSLKSGTVCRYKVKAVGGSVSGSATKAATATKTSTPTLKAKSSSGKVTLSWTKSARADGYQIVMSSTKNGKYTAVKYIKNAGTLQYTKTKLVTGKTYYFKARSYKTVDGKRLYSSYSNAVKVKIK